MRESLFWRNGDRCYLGLIKNATDQKELSVPRKLPEVQAITSKMAGIRLEFKDSGRRIPSEISKGIKTT